MSNDSWKTPSIFALAYVCLVEKVAEMQDIICEFPDKTETEQAKKNCADTLKTIQDLIEKLR